VAIIAAMEAILWLFGDGDDLTFWQTAARAVAMFVVGLVLIRVSGRRSFGQQNPFDACMTVMLGAILSRAVMGVSAFWPTVAAAAALALTHRLVALAACNSPRFDLLVSGPERELLRDGVIDREQMRAALITYHDLMAAIRRKTGREDPATARRATLERDGTITVVPREGA
jgi:uncharacterized membrane protein YcaP (DUF421 family)